MTAVRALTTQILLHLVTSLVAWQEIRQHAKDKVVNELTGTVEMLKINYGSLIYD